MVLFIEDSDRRESWLNCGALVYDQRMPNQVPKSRPLLIASVFTNDEASVVLDSYEDIILNKSGICMKMLGPGDKERLLETCITIVIENSNTNEDAVSQIYKTFLYNTITDGSVMQTATLDHYVVMETEGLEHMQAVFEEMNNEANVVMIRTRTPYNGGGIIFMFNAAMVTTMRQVR